MRSWKVVRYRGRFAVIFTDKDGKRRRRSLGKIERHEVERVAANVVAAATAEQQEAYTVDQVLDMYFESTDAISKKTLEFHARDVRSFFGRTLAKKAGAGVREYTAARKAKVAPGTIRKELGLLRAALNRAERDGIIERAPFIQLPPAPPPRDRRLTKEEATALMFACEHTHLLLFVMLAYYTAARSSAILSLKWSQVDLEKRQIDLGGTGRQKRRAVVAMADNLGVALYQAKQAALSPYVVEYGGRRVTTIKKGFKAACVRAGIEDCSPHVLRHTAASLMAARGVPLDKIAQVLGHTNPSVTYRVYARFRPDHLRDAVDAL